MEGTLNQFIKKSIEHYDTQNINYSDFINNLDISFDVTENIIKFSSTDENHFEILGYFDNETNIWIWGWLLSDVNLEETQLCTELLKYGLKLEKSSNMEEHVFIKSLLLNSRILIEESVQLDVNLAIYSYLLKNKYLFIYPNKKYIDESKKKYITYYYLIK